MGRRKKDVFFLSKITLRAKHIKKLMYIYYKSQRKKAKKYNCIACGKTFISDFWGDRIYCSKECYYKKGVFRKILKFCKLCNTGFYTTSLNRGYCENCIRIKCKICGNIFKDIPTNKRKFCSVKCSRENSKSRIPWNKGKKNIYSQSTLQKISKNSQGSNAWNWKGGITPLAEKIRHLSENKKWTFNVFKKDDFTCQECGFINGKGIHKNLIAHHKKSFSIIFKEFLQTFSQFSPIEDKETLLRLAISYQPFWNISNGKTLCEECHKKTKNFGGKILKAVEEYKQIHCGKGWEE